MTSNATKQTDRTKHVTVLDPNGSSDGRLERGSRKGSFKKSLFKAFGKKKGASANVEETIPTSPTTKPKK